LLAKDKISVPGASQKAIFKCESKKLMKFSEFFSGTDLQAKMVSLDVARLSIKI
jgi:hypothetical protein